MELWCWDDPTVSINGKPVTFQIGVQGSPADIQAAGIVAHVTITVPTNVTTSVVDLQQGAFTQQLQFASSGKTAPSKQRIPVQVYVTFTYSGPDRHTGMSLTHNGRSYHTSGNLSGHMSFKFEL